MFEPDQRVVDILAEDPCYARLISFQCRKQHSLFQTCMKTVIDKRICLWKNIYLSSRDLPPVDPPIECSQLRRLHRVRGSGESYTSGS
jgi:hypothetical protein